MNYPDALELYYKLTKQEGGTCYAEREELLQALQAPYKELMEEWKEFARLLKEERNVSS